MKKIAWIGLGVMGYMSDWTNDRCISCVMAFSS